MAKDLIIREWLNREGHQSVAGVYARVDTDGDANLIISDCTRQVSLDLYGHDRESAENVLHKLDLLRDTIGKVRRRLHREFKKKYGI